MIRKLVRLAEPYSGEFSQPRRVTRPLRIKRDIPKNRAKSRKEFARNRGLGTHHSGEFSLPRWVTVLVRSLREIPKEVGKNSLDSKRNFETISKREEVFEMFRDHAHRPIFGQPFATLFMPVTRIDRTDTATVYVQLKTAMLKTPIQGLNIVQKCSNKSRGLDKFQVQHFEHRSWSSKTSACTCALSTWALVRNTSLAVSFQAKRSVTWRINEETFDWSYSWKIMKLQSKIFFIERHSSNFKHIVEKRSVVNWSRVHTGASAWKKPVVWCRPLRTSRKI